jgi:hypothetical protein
MNPIHNFRPTAYAKDSPQFGDDGPPGLIGLAVVGGTTARAFREF